MLQQERITDHAVAAAARLLLAGLVLFAITARAEQFTAPFGSAEWRVERSPISCRLRQSVPRYGEAVFEALAGGNQSLVLRAGKNPMIEGPALLVAAAPPWNPQRAGVELGHIDIAGGNEPLRLQKAESQRVLDSLNDGLAPQFSRPLESDRERNAVLTLSPLNFRAAYRQYRDCVQAMVPVSYEQIAHTTVVFAAERAELTADAQKKIDTLLRYAQADRAVTGFALNAISADTPRRLENLALAKERAEQVSEYLMSRGIAPAKISSDYRGERRGERGGTGDLRSVTIKLRRAP